MPMKPRETVDVPLEPIPTWVFGSPDAVLSDEAIILDPRAPEKRWLSLRSYRYWSQRLARGLQDAGLQVGHRLLFLSENSTACPIVIMGTLMAGGVVSAQSPTLPIAKLERQAAEVQPSFIFVSEKGFVAATELAKRLSLSQDRVLLFNDDFLFEGQDPSAVQMLDGRPHWARLLKATSAPFDWTPYTAPEQLAVISYTSGSTGDSKGVMISHHNLVANGVQFIHQQTQDQLDLAQNKRLALVMWPPIYGIIGVTQYCMISPKRGMINYIMDHFDLETLVRYAEKYRATHLFFTPGALITLLSHPVAKNADLSSVYYVSVGGAPIRESTLERLQDIMTNKSLQIVQSWGMTELTGVAIATSFSAPTHIRSQGQLMANCEAKTMTPDGSRELGPDEPGELYVRSPNRALGYANLPEKSSMTFLPDGWLRTGDLAVYDSQGNWFIKDRIQDMIAHESGSYALPTDLESRLIGIPGVKDAGIALIDPPPGETYRVPRAFVALDHTKHVDVASIASDFNQRSEAHEQLRGGVYEMDAIPRLPSGKVDRISLRNRQVDDKSKTA